MKISNKRGKRNAIPWISAAIAVACVFIYAIPGAFDTLHFRRADVLAGEWWRIFTSHLTHGSLGHLFWGSLIFLSLSVLAEKRMGRIYPVFLLASALALGIGLLLQGRLQNYCGLSGLVAALFGYLLLEQWSWAKRTRDQNLLALCALWIATFLGQLLWETLMPAPAAYTPVPFVHLLGLLLGVTVFVSAAKLKPTA